MRVSFNASLTSFKIIFVAVLGKRLNTTVHKHLTAMSEFDCAAHCSKDSCCRSANFRKISPHDGRENCELLHAVEREEPGYLQENGTYDYLIMIQPQRVSKNGLDNVVTNVVISFILH